MTKQVINNPSMPRWKANKMAYIKKYNEEKYRTFTIKFRNDTEQEMIEYLKQSGCVQGEIKRIIRQYLKID